MNIRNLKKSTTSIRPSFTAYLKNNEECEDAMQEVFLEVPVVRTGI